MKYTDTELVFTSQPKPPATASRSLTDEPTKAGETTPETEVLGIKLRLGNQPMVYNLKDLILKSGKPLPEEIDITSEKKDCYLIVHAISALRTQGRAKVEELQYFASSAGVGALQTLDLIPKTRFNEILKVGVTLESVLGLSGQALADVPSITSSTLLSKYVDIGADMKLQLSSSADLVGKFIYSIHIPVIQTAGIGSDFCSWILKPDETDTPLLGDQLLVQSIAVPKGTSTITYKLSGLVKADRGLFWRQQQKQTPEYLVEVKLI